MTKDKKILSISDELYERLRHSADDSGFESTEEFVNFVLEELVSKDEGGRELTDDERQKIDINLQEMGYKP